MRVERVKSRIGIRRVDDIFDPIVRRERCPVWLRLSGEGLGFQKGELPGLVTTLRRGPWICHMV